jgi:hypothetical protein
MRIREEYWGAKKIICSVVLEDGESPAVEFLEKLKLTNPQSHKTMVYRYKRHADNGPSRNTKHERPIVSSGNLWEFKTNAGDRLLYFNHSGNRVILIDGFHSSHKRQDQQHYSRAAQLRDEYLAEEKERGSAGNRTSS